MEGLKVYKVQVFSRKSRSGKPIDPLDRVICSEMNIHGVRKWLSERYDGFIVDIQQIEPVSMPAPEGLATPAESLKEEDRYRTTWIRDCRLSGGEVTPELEAAINGYGKAKEVLDKCEEEVKAIVRAIELAKPLVREVNLTGIRIDPTRPIAVSGISIMLEGGYLENLGGGKEEKPL